jgi:hypothetical protein
MNHGHGHDDVVSCLLALMRPQILLKTENSKKKYHLEFVYYIGTVLDKDMHLN